MKPRTWVVREGDGALIDDIVTLAGGDASALDGGRVFVGRVRKRPGDAVAIGDEVQVHAPISDLPNIAILHHAGGILAVDKPAGVSTIPDEHDAEGSLLHRVARAVGVRPATLHPTSRLDRGVSGVVLFAETSRAREHLHDARAQGTYIRRYVAMASKAPAPPTGEWNARIGRARDPKKRMVNGRDATDALTRYRVVASAPRATLIAMEPITGRTHQIRVHASHAGSALMGDKDYGGSRTLVLPTGKVLSLERVALHCARVEVKGFIDVRAPIPAELRLLWRELGGQDEAWTAAGLGPG